MEFGVLLAVLAVILEIWRARRTAAALTRLTRTIEAMETADRLRRTGLANLEKRLDGLEQALALGPAPAMDRAPLEAAPDSEADTAPRSHQEPAPAEVRRLFYGADYDFSDGLGTAES